MTEQGTLNPEQDLVEVARENPFLAEHIREHNSVSAEYPKYVEEPLPSHETDRPNLLYRVSESVFVHIYGDSGDDITYFCVEPSLDDEENEVYEAVRDRVLDLSAERQPPKDEDEFEVFLEDLLSDIVTLDGDERRESVLQRLGSGLLERDVTVTQETYERIGYNLRRNIVGLGPLDPVMKDTKNEDIHILGPHNCYVDHSVFGMMTTTVDFGSTEYFESWIRNMGERMDHPVSDSHPIIDSTLPDGSRINIMYSDDISLKGPTLTIRQAEEVPLSILQITEWGTLSPKLAAYLWLCMENDRTVFVVGETAAGKTTTLNSMFSFIPRDHKIYTAEDTSEVSPPHDNWQQLLTREGQNEEANVDMFDLVAAALRSRPDYICVGEVRGPEAQMAFQAAQTGHPVLVTFHASDIVSMIQRLTGEPINVPKAFIDNCDVALFQNRVKQGDDVLRRVTSVQEIEGYSEEEGGVVTRQTFDWDPQYDRVEFTGQNNSYVLEEQIATLLGYSDVRHIYDELERRAEIIRRLIDADVTGYHEVNEAIEKVQREGVESLPIEMRGVTKNAVPE